MSGNENKAEGKGKEIMGKVKEAAGSLVGNEKLKREGQADQVEGNTQQAAGDVQNAAENTKDAITPNDQRNK